MHFDSDIHKKDKNYIVHNTKICLYVYKLSCKLLTDFDIILDKTKNNC